MKKFIFIILGSMILFSCDEPEVDRKIKAHTNSYVNMYHSYNEIRLVWAGHRFLRLEFVYDDSYGILSEDEEGKLKYKAKCDKYNDYLGYEKMFYYYEWEMPHSYQDRDFAEIEITSDADYDPAHPAGTSLNDLFYFASSSPIKYIQRRYVEVPVDFSSLPQYYPTYMNLRYSEDPALEPVYGLLSDMSSQDWVLLGNWRAGSGNIIASFTPVKKPESAHLHNFTVRLTDTDGQVLSATVRAEFE